ncbi:helix-turn-helix domain-containing protein [Streptomyces sp. NPDC001435]
MAGATRAGIADELGCRQKTARCWLHRFNRSGGRPTPPTRPLRPRYVYTV